MCEPRWPLDDPGRFRGTRSTLVVQQGFQENQPPKLANETVASTLSDMSLDVGASRKAQRAMDLTMRPLKEAFCLALRPEIASTRDRILAKGFWGCTALVSGSRQLATVHSLAERRACRSF